MAGDGPDDQLYLWVLFGYGFDLADWDNWLDRLPNCGAKTELQREREALAHLFAARQHARIEDKLKIMALRRSMVTAKPVAESGVQAAVQRKAASESAKRERVVALRARDELVADLAGKVSPRVRAQGKTATAREVRKLASKLQTADAQAIADLTERRLVSLIFRD